MNIVSPLILTCFHDWIIDPIESGYPELCGGLAILGVLAALRGREGGPLTFKKSPEVSHVTVRGQNRRHDDEARVLLLVSVPHRMVLSQSICPCRPYPQADW